MWHGAKEKKIPTQLMKVGKKDCVKNMMGDADNFSIPFPQGATFRDRALLIAAGLLIDYRMFEEKGGAQGGSGRRH